MTIQKLITELEKMKAKHGPRCKVCIDSTDLITGNGTWDIVHIYRIRHEVVPQVDDDGSFEYTQSGNQKTSECIVLS